MNFGISREKEAEETEADCTADIVCCNIISSVFVLEDSGILLDGTSV